MLYGRRPLLPGGVRSADKELEPQSTPVGLAEWIARARDRMKSDEIPEGL